MLRVHKQGLEVVVKLPLIRRYKAKEGRTCGVADLSI
jgi:hypothetical protein